MPRKKLPEGQLPIPYKLKAKSGSGRYTPWPVKGYHTAKEENKSATPKIATIAGGVIWVGHEEEVPGDTDDPV